MMTLALVLCCGAVFHETHLELPDLLTEHVRSVADTTDDAKTTCNNVDIIVTTHPTGPKLVNLSENGFSKHTTD